MGKFYMWLEWFAILILTMASVIFGYIQAHQGSSLCVRRGCCSAAMYRRGMLSDGGGLEVIEFVV